MGYYDVGELLAEEERVVCTFQTQAWDCGFMDPSCVERDLAQGAKLELPVWLASALGRRGDVHVEVPTCLEERKRGMVKAGPAAANLRDLSPYYYELGQILLPLIQDEEEARAIEEILRVAFGGERYKQILDNSMHSLDQDTTEFTRKLTQFEKELFQAGVCDATDYLQWKARKSELISCSKVVQMKKRKRV